MARGPIVLLVALLLAAGLLVALLMLGGGAPEPAPELPGSGGAAPASRPARDPGEGDGTRARVVLPGAETAGTTTKPEPAPAETRSGITVRTRFQDGTPVPCVIVDFVRPGTSGYAAGEMQAVTDLEGVARFAEVAPGDWVVRTDRFVDESLTVSDGGQAAEVVLILPRGVEIRGLVLDPAGAPMAGAEIWRGPTRDPRETHRVDARSAPVARSRPDGTFLLPGFGPKPVWVWVAARHPDHAPSAWVGVHNGDYYTAAPEQVELRLRAGSSVLTGRVLAGPEREPVAGARISVEPLDAGRESLPNGGVLDFDVDRTTTTDGDGAFRLESLLPGTKIVEASATGYASTRQEVVVTAGVDPPLLELLVEAGHGVTVEVSDPEGRPVPGVTCSVRCAAGARRSAVTDAAGRCAVDDLPAGTATLRLDREGYRRVSETIVIGAEREPLQFVLHPKPVVRGRLLRADGTVLGGWLVGATRSSPEPGSPPTPRGGTRSDEDGAFELFLSAEEPVTLSAVSGGGLSLPVELADGRPIEPDGEPIDFVVPDDQGRGGHVTARIEAGERPWFTLVTLIDGRPTTQRSGAEIQGGYDPLTATLGLGPLPAGRYLLRVHVDPAQGRSPYQQGLRFDSQPFELSDGARVDLGVLAPPPHGVLRWILRPGRGCTPREPRLQWPPPTDGPAEPGLVMLDPTLHDGNVTGTLPMLPGRYEFTFWGEGFLSETRSIDLAAGQTVDVDVALHAAQRLPIRLTLPDGIDHATFEIHDPRGVLVHEDEFGTDEARSVVRYPVLPLGRHDVVVRADDRRWTGTFEVRSLTPTREPLTFELRPDR